SYNKDDVLKLLKVINKLLDSCGDKSLKESNLESVFNTFWPQLEEKLNATPKDKAKHEPVRTERELLEESLQILRTLKENSLPSGPSISPVASSGTIDYG